MSQFNYDRAAAALVDAMLTNDETAARKHGISVRSVERYRDRCSSDPQLAASVGRMTDAKIGDWASDLPSAIASGINFLKKAFDEADYRDPEVQTALAQGLKILSDIDITRKIVDAQLQQSQPLAASQGAYFDEGVAEGTIDTTAEEITN